MAGLVVGDGDVEGVEEIGKFGGAVGGECWTQVGEGGEQCFDVVRLWLGGSTGRELALLYFERGALDCELFDAGLCSCDDGMGGVVVFFEAKALSAHGLFDLCELSREGGEFALVVVVDRVERLRELVVEEAEPVRAEEAAGEEVEQWIEDRLFADAEDTRMAGGVGGCDSSFVDELAAVPVEAFLVAAFHAPAADTAANATAQRVQASATAAAALDVALRFGQGCATMIARGAFLDLLE